MKELWIKYKESEIPNDKYELTEIALTCDGVKIVLRGHKNILIVTHIAIHSLKLSDEGIRIRTYHEIEEIQGYRNDFYGHPMYEVSNSEFFEWAMKESAGFGYDLKHYVLMTQNDIVDLLVTFPPEITVRKLEEEGCSRVKTIGSEHYDPFSDLS